MVNPNRIAEIGLLIGEPARAAMLTALMDGRALTATELARCANITRQTASSHLSRLTSAELLKVAKQGRHRYHRLASPDIAQLIEDIMQIASKPIPSRREFTVGPRDRAMRFARTCYDHLAGRVAIAITESLLAKGVIEFEDDAGIVTEAGIEFLRHHHIEFNVNKPGNRVSSRPLCRPCLDWSERRPHVAGKVGAAICAHFLDKKLFRRIDNTRALRITPNGHNTLRTVFGIRDMV